MRAALILFCIELDVCFVSRYFWESTVIRIMFFNRLFYDLRDALIRHFIFIFSINPIH